MNRETKIIKVGDHELVVKTYATAREANEIQQTYFKGSKVEMTGDTPKIQDFNPGIQFEVEKELVNQLVVRMDNSDVDIVDRVLDLPSDEYHELISQLDGLVAKKKS